jgi:hypothetical protein
MTIERCDNLDANVTYSVNVEHEDINFLKLKNYDFYEQYLSNDYYGLIKYLSNRLGEFL